MRKDFECIIFISFLSDKTPLKAMYYAENSFRKSIPYIGNFPSFIFSFSICQTRERERYLKFLWGPKGMKKIFHFVGKRIPCKDREHEKDTIIIIL